MGIPGELFVELGRDIQKQSPFPYTLGLSMDEKVWDATVLSKNRERLLKGELAQASFEAVLGQAREQGLLSDEHFTVDGTLLEAWASKRSHQKEERPSACPFMTPGTSLSARSKVR